MSTLIQKLTLKASLNSSSPSDSFIFLAIIPRNSVNSMVPFPSMSTSFIMSCSSPSVGFWPSDRITVPNSTICKSISLQLQSKIQLNQKIPFVVMVPSESRSNNEKASLNSIKKKKLLNHNFIKIISKSQRCLYHLLVLHLKPAPLPIKQKISKVI